MRLTQARSWTILSLGVLTVALLAGCGGSTEPDRQRRAAEKGDHERRAAGDTAQDCRATEEATQDRQAAETPAARSGGGGRIAFARARGSIFTDIYVMNPDGSEQIQVTDTRRAAEEGLTWSADGDRIAFDRFEGKQSDIWVMNSDGSGQVNLTDTPEVIEAGAAWSPDGQRIAYTSSEQHDIWVMNPDGSGQLNLTDTPEVSEGAPAWSPDGQEIAFVLERPRKSDPSTSVGGIYAMDADGSAQHLLTSGPEFKGVYPASPAFFPDEGRIAFLGQCRGVPGWVIWTMGADGSDPTPLENVARSEPFAPVSFSADGNRIVFSGGDGGDGIFIMNADGSNQMRLPTAAMTIRIGRRYRMGPS